MSTRSFKALHKLVQPHARQAVSLKRSPISKSSYFGGDPELPEGVEWPARNGEPLRFLACIDLTEISNCEVIHWLPPEGRLLFFFDAKNQPTGLDPADGDACKVLFLREEGSGQSSDEPPRMDVVPAARDSLPDWQRLDALGLDFSEDEIDVYLEGSQRLSLLYGVDQIAGYPEPEQEDDMELQCQLASNGIPCGDPDVYDSAEAEALRAGADDWRLLLQLASYEELGMVWGELGTLFFWVREQDAMVGNFDDAWVVLQSG